MWKFIGDRLACALLGAIFGAIYGSLLSIIVAWISDGHFRTEYVWYGIAVFGSLGLVTGPFVGDVIGDMLHVIYGLFAGILSGEGETVDPEPKASGWLRIFFILGFGTGLLVFFVWRTS